MFGPVNWIINRNTASAAPPILILGIVHETGAAEGMLISDEPGLLLGVLVVSCG